MPLSDVLNSGLTKGLTIEGPIGGNNSPGSETVKCGNVPKVVMLCRQLDMSNTVTGGHMRGGHSLKLAGALGGDTYWLPWGAWRAYMGQLGSACDYFVTANLTGCGVFVSGPRTAPHVVHANCVAGDVVDYPEGIKDFAMANKVYTDDLEAARLQYYGQVAAKLVDLGYIPSANLQMLTPSDYGAKAKDGYAVPTSVFGVRTGGNWTIYYNVGRNGGAQALTRQLYPTFEAL